MTERNQSLAPRLLVFNVFGKSAVVILKISQLSYNIGSRSELMAVK